MDLRLRSVEPGLICLACRGVISHPVNASNDPLQTLLPSPNWQGNVLVDCTQAEYIGTEGIGWLVQWHQRIEKAGGVLCLCGVPPRLVDMLQLCRLHLFLPIHESEAVARAALATRTPASPPPEPIKPPAPVIEETAIAPAPAAPVRNLAEPDPALAQKDESTATVLVVDDSSVERRRAGGALETPAHTGGPGGGMIRGSDTFASSSIRVRYAVNGRDALEKIKQSPPDLVVTDLVMPDLDGLGLVKEVRATYPAIPVVLMTAHGSEEIAAAALQAGAASYVPKRYLARDLAETVDTILHLARTSRQQQVILEHLLDSESRFLLPSKLDLVSPLVGFLQSHLKRIGLADGDLHLPIALHEALVNAITHGNLEAPGHLRESDYSAYLKCIKERQTTPPYCDRRVHVLARETREELVYVIRDEGPGFDTTTLPDPTSTDELKKASGRGLFLIHTFMDEVRFNATGNEITLIKRR